MSSSLGSAAGKTRRLLQFRGVLVGLAWRCCLGALISFISLLRPHTSLAQEPTAVVQALKESTSAAQVDLDDLVQVQSKVKQILSKVQPCVVAVEGGSGVIVSADGLILTASHVSGRTGRVIKVTLPDGRVVEATTLGTNNATDASAMRINAPGPWPHLPLKVTPALDAGDWCVAFGYPSGFPRNTNATVRLGRILNIEDRELTTDCVLMGGDSGGPLVNLDGDLIGINSRVKNKLDENYHIPSSIYHDEMSTIAAATDIRQQISPTGQRAYLGLHAESDNNRVRIRKVHADSPAETAGLKPEDVILQFDGESVSNFDQILKSVEGRSPDEEIMLIINRYGKLNRVYLRLGRQY